MIIGIDPGKKGALAVIFEKGGVELLEMPSNYDLFFALSKLKEMAELNNEAIVAFVEQAYIVQKQKKQIDYIKHAGAIEQSLRVLNIPFQLIHPITWKNKLHLSKDKKASISLVLDIFGGQLASEIGNSDGKAEALLIAYYGKRFL